MAEKQILLIVNGVRVPKLDETTVWEASTGWPAICNPGPRIGFCFMEGSASAGRTAGGSVPAAFSCAGVLADSSFLPCLLEAV